MTLPATSVNRIGHYELIERIGGDDSADTYRARDTRLERDVAVRLLRLDATAGSDTPERFRREARIASLVTHPHICTVHDSGEESGYAYLVHELLEGQTLDKAVAGRPLPADRVLDLGLQIADAVAAAHRRGIVLGRLRSAGVFVTSDGHVKLCDFGYAGSVAPPAGGHADALTETTDPRRDIFAVGELLYEMATGASLCAGATARGAMAEYPPVRPRSVNPTLPPAIESIIQRALAKDPLRRYQTAAALLDDLRRGRRSLDASRRLSSPWRLDQRTVRVASAAALAIVLVGLTVLARFWWRPTAANPDVERSAVLVGHIANGTADPDFDGTLREAVAVYLAQSPYLDLVSDDRIRGTLQMMGREPNARMTHDVAAEVCQRLGLQAMLEGSVSAIGRTTSIALVATDCGSGATIAREQLEVDRKEEVLQALGRLTASMRKALGESVAALARHNVPIEEATTPSLQALKAYTEALSWRAAGDEMEAVKLLEHAVAIDPRFALAYTTLSTVYGGIGETGRSEAYARLAFDHRSRVSERERFFISYQYHDGVTGDQVKARQALEVWKATYPRDYRPANALAVMLNRFGNYTAAAREATEAIGRNPAHAFPRSNLAHAYRGSGRLADARAVAEDALARNLETAPMRRLLYQLAEMEGDGAAAQRQIEWAASRTRGFDMTGARAQVAVFRGHFAEARRLYAETIATATERRFPQVASGYAAQLALAEAVYGYRRDAIAHGRDVLRTATAHEPQLRAATALAISGAPDEAEAVLRRLRKVRPDDTLLHGAYVPVAEAAVLLARDRIDDAVEHLRRAAPYEQGMVAALVPIYLRGDARLRAGMTQDAVREFETLLAHRGADPFSPLVPLSRLGLARAHARAGDLDASRTAYVDLLRTWASADADVPLLREARRELARLQ